MDLPLNSLQAGTEHEPAAQERAEHSDSTLLMATEDPGATPVASRGDDDNAVVSASESDADVDMKGIPDAAERGQDGQDNQDDRSVQNDHDDHDGSDNEEVVHEDSRAVMDAAEDSSTDPERPQPNTTEAELDLDLGEHYQDEEGEQEANEAVNMKNEGDEEVAEDSNEPLKESDDIKHDRTDIEMKDESIPPMPSRRPAQPSWSTKVKAAANKARRYLPFAAIKAKRRALVLAAVAAGVGVGGVIAARANPVSRHVLPQLTSARQALGWSQQGLETPATYANASLLEMACTPSWM